jgi:hypothetical protein
MPDEQKPDELKLDERLWRYTTGDPVQYGDMVDVPLVGHRCTYRLSRTINGVNTATHHGCKQVANHEGVHMCICGAKWYNPYNPGSVKK